MNDLEFIDPEQKFVDTYVNYADYLDVPWYEQLKEVMYQYFSKIHTDAKTQIMISYVLSFFLAIQGIFPTLAQQSYQQKSNLLAKTVKILSTIWCGGGMFGENPALVTSFVISLIFSAFMIFTFFHALRYNRVLRLSLIESNTVFIVYNYIIPIIVPFITAGTGQSIEHLIKGQISAFSIITLILSIFVFAVHLLFQYMFYSPRIMFLADVTLNWNSLSSMLITLCNGLLSLLTSATISITDSKISILIATLIITYLQLFLSVYLFVNISFVNRKIGSIYSGILFGCGVSNIVNIIAVYKTINYTIIFLVTILLVVASIPLFLMISNKIVQKALTRISFVDDENLKTIYNKADEFISDVKLTIEFCPPQVFSWTLYEFFLELEPRNNDLILLYCRLISAFPRYQYHLPDVAKFMNYSTIKLRRIYYLQLMHIIRHRHTTTTTEVISFFNEYDNQNRILQLLTQKFWENVLSENRSAFWINLLDYHQEIKNMEVLVRQAVNDFENSPEVISQAIKTYQTVTFNFHQASKHSDELKLLMSGVPAHPDRALKNILQIFPLIGGISAEVVQDIEISGHAIDMHDIDSDMMQRKEVVYDLLKHQKVGQIWLQVIYFIMASVLLIVFGSVYISKLSSTVVNEITQTSNFMIEASTLLHVFSRYALFKSLNRGLYHTKDTPMSNSDETMKQISPNWYPKYISKYDPSDEKMASLEYSLKQELGLTIEKLRELDQSRDNVKVFNNRFLVEQFEPYNYTLNELMVNIFSYENLDLTFLQMTKSAFTYLKDMIAEFADATDFTDSPLSINILMVFTLLIDLLVYSLPMVLYYFLIHVQMEDICSMYFSLPMSEVKKIIGDQTKAKKENSLAMTLISSSDNKFLNLPMSITLILTIIPTFAVIYTAFFMQKSFTIHTAPDCQASGYLKTPFSSMRISMLATALSFIECYPLDTKGRDRQEVKDLLLFREKLLSETKSDLGTHLIKVREQLPSWIDIMDKYRWQYPPLEESLTKIPADGNGFERLASQNFLMQTDTAILLISITEPGLEQSLEYLNLLSYYFYWLNDNVEKYYFETIEEKIHNDTSKGNDFVIPLIFVLIFFVLVTFIYFVYNAHKNSKILQKSMSLLLYIDPMVVLSQNTVMDMIQSGRCRIVNTGNFQESDRFTLLTKTGIAVLNRNLEIIEYNEQFEKIFPNLKNFHELEHTKDCEYFVTKIMNNFVKCEEPRFMKIIELNGSYFEIECVCFSDMKESLEFDTNQVTSCVVITRDITSSVRNQQIIEKEHRNISMMLSKILPHQVIEDIDNGGDRLSFSAHLVTIGDISFTPIFDEQTEISGQSSKISLQTIDEKVPIKIQNEQKNENQKSDTISSNEKQNVPENLSSNKLNLNDDKNDIYNLISQRSSMNEEIPQQSSRKSIYQLNDSTKTEIPSQNSKLSMNCRKPVFVKPNLEGKGITKYQSSGLIIRKKEIDMKDKNKLEKVQQFNSKMICVLDEYISKYKTLSKVKSFMNTYRFCGGLFMSVNKPVEHAEESVRFCLEILRDHDKIQKIVGFDFVFQIGLHTGGPVIAGITSLDYPMFSLLSNVSDLPILMREKCEENTIKVTRAVYELIFSFGFQISESQNVKHGNISIPTYTIVL